MLLGSLFCSKLLNFIPCGLMEALPKLIFVVVVLISTILFSPRASAYFSWIPPVYITEHIQKYCSIENFKKLPFQRVLIHLNRSQNEGPMAVLFPLLHVVHKISERATFGNSAIPACRNLRLTWFLIRWKRNFMGILNIDILLFSLEVVQKLMGTETSCDPNMLTTLIL
jgi:hypothetical protein